MNGLGFSRSDILGSKIYANYRSLLYTRNICLRESPHIFSHTILNIEAATDNEEYFFDKNFENNAIKVAWSFNETGCTTSSCFPTYPLSETCKPGDAPFSFGLPNGHRMDACQPACFHTTENVKDDQHRMPPYTIWFEDSCLINNHAMTSFFVDPSKHCDDGKIDVTGFDIYVTKIGADDNPVTCARINQKYCESFYLDYIKDYEKNSLPGDMACGYDGATYYLQLFIGSSLIKLFRMSGDLFEKAVKIYKREILRDVKDKNDLPDFLQHRSPTRFFLRSLKKWKNHIDLSKRSITDDITLSDLGFVPSQRDRLIWTDRYSHIDDGRNDRYGGRLMEKRRGIPAAIDLNYIGDGNEGSGYRLTDTKKIVDEILEPTSKRITRQMMPFDEKAGRLSENELLDAIQKVLYNLGGSLSNEEIGETTLQFGADGGLAIFRHYLKTLGPKVINAFLRSEMLEIGKRISAKLLTTVVSHAMFNVIVESITVHFGRVAMLLLGIASTAATVIGWLLAIGPILDILFTFIWDPFDFSRPAMSDSLLRKLSESTLMHQQVQCGSRRIEMTPYVYWQLHVSDTNGKGNLTHETQHSMCVLKHTLIYFINRKTSSDGSKIEWSDDDLITLSDQAVDSVEENRNGEIAIRTVFRQLIVKNMMINAEDIRYYQRRIEERATNADYVVGGSLMVLLPVLYIARDSAPAILVVFLIVVINVVAVCNYSIFNVDDTHERRSNVFGKVR